MTAMRTLIDRFLQLGIKLCLLTGVAFTFAACYGPPPERHCYGPAPTRERYNDPEYQNAQLQVEQQLKNVAEDETDPKE